MAAALVLVLAVLVRATQAEAVQSGRRGEEEVLEVEETRERDLNGMMGCSMGCTPVASPTAPPTPKPTVKETDPPTDPPTPKETDPPTDPPTPKETDPPTDPPTPKESEPTPKPTPKPTKAETDPPTDPPTPKEEEPTPKPTPKPTSKETDPPTDEQPTKKPTKKPTTPPTEEDTPRPTKKPTKPPTNADTPNPTKKPTRPPTNADTPNPTKKPTRPPTEPDTPNPTKKPTRPPTNADTPNPTKKPTRPPTEPDTPNPTKKPTRPPTNADTPNPTKKPTRPPTDPDTPSPTPKPTRPPTRQATPKPTPQPTRNPTRPPSPKATPEPTRQPTPRVTVEAPVDAPTSAPTEDLCANDDWDASNEESDADCGGDLCEARCNVTQRCFLASDCDSGLACGFDAGELRGACLVPTEGAINFPACEPGLPCQPSSSSSSQNGTCVLLEGVSDRKGRCMPKPGDVSREADEGECTWAWRSILATVLLALCLALSAGMGDTVLFVQALDLGHIIASGAFLLLPAAPACYLAFATDMRWSTLALLPLPRPLSAGTSEASSVGTITEGRRALAVRAEDLANLTWEDMGMSRMARLADIDRQFMLCGFLVLLFAVMIIYALVQIAMAKGKDWRACIRETMVRIPYMVSYPLVAFAAYTLYLVFIVDAVSSTALEAVLGLLAFCVLLLSITWAMICFRYTLPARPPKTFRSLHADWKANKRLFWIARLLSNAFKGFFVGMVSQPAPIQAVLFLVVGVAYWLALFRWMPYEYSLTNRIALFAALLYIINTVIPVIFAMNPPAYSSSILELLGEVQIWLNIASLVLMLAIMLSQMYGKWRDKRRHVDIAKAHETAFKDLEKDYNKDNGNYMTDDPHTGSAHLQLVYELQRDRASSSVTADSPDGVPVSPIARAPPPTPVAASSSRSGNLRRTESVDSSDPHTRVAMY
ncbi:Hypothetical Protein FCC1311_098632 [Hondaea fermentalgiana]|uniref:Uncharacterized protein n=1 Tax=Hondaea fermentalgiana TaxID=2315210 RepID=A0A2R5GS16_9STRA|nr:Hypothetical Protein FCC1311_098632 [Hondaea fermentalgiana]|eukprot:GBG33640.1 Hypothetical Protein FCC1311_098632 [Hondaea fermentalgiana]